MHLSVYKVLNLGGLHAEQPSRPTPSRAKLSCIAFAFSTLQSDGEDHTCSTMGGQEKEGGNMYETQVQQPETGACVTSYIAIAENIAIMNEKLLAPVRSETALL